MPPPPGVRALRGFPDIRPVQQRGGIRIRATGGWEMARRATRALAAMLVAAGLALPAVLLVSQPAAAAVTSQQPPPVSIVITAMSPRWATPRATITVTGTLHNNSRTAASQLTVQLFGSSTPVASVTALQQGMSPSGSPATAALPGRTWHASGQLAPGASTDWSVKVPASACEDRVALAVDRRSPAQRAMAGQLLWTAGGRPGAEPQPGRAAGRACQHRDCRPGRHLGDRSGRPGERPRPDDVSEVAAAVGTDGLGMAHQRGKRDLGPTVECHALRRPECRCPDRRRPRVRRHSVIRPRSRSR